jgi:predicted O-methyltransferase YrrM
MNDMTESVKAETSMASGIFNIPSRIARRLGRIPALRSVIQRLNDSGRQLSFRMEHDEEKARLDGYRQCRTPEEFFSFISGVPGMAPHQLSGEILLFLNFAGARSPANVCEIGTAGGGNNFLLSQAMPSVKFMLGIDLFVRNKHFLRNYCRPGQEFRYLDASSHASKTVEKVGHLLAGRKLDLLFIDGDHAYEGVTKDFVLYREYVREGGLIAFHDIVRDDRTRYGRETGRWAGDVPLFWQEIRSLFPSAEFVEHCEQDGCGIGCIEYREAVQLPTNL